MFFWIPAALAGLGLLLGTARGRRLFLRDPAFVGRGLLGLVVGLMLGAFIDMAAGTWFVQYALPAWVSALAGSGYPGDDTKGGAVGPSPDQQSKRRS